MKHSTSFLLLITLLTFSCKTVQKTQVIQEAISKKDTAQTIVISETPKVDSAAIVKDIMHKVVQGKIDFNTFNAKIKVTYESAEKSDTYTVYLSMKKDSGVADKAFMNSIQTMMKNLEGTPRATPTRISSECLRLLHCQTRTARHKVGCIVRNIDLGGRSADNSRSGDEGVASLEDNAIGLPRLGSGRIFVSLLHFLIFVGAIPRL